MSRKSDTIYIRKEIIEGMKKLYNWLYDEDELSYEDFEKRMYVLGAIAFMSIIFTILIKLS